MARKILIPLSLALYTLIMVLPPIIHHYIYPNMGDDFATVVNYIKDYPNLFNITHFGYAYIGYPLRWIHSISNLPYTQMYLWYSYLIVIGVGFSTYFVLSKLVNWKAGILSLAFPFFVSLGLPAQFDFGMMFNMVNVGIILPFLIYLSIMWVSERKVRQLVGVLLLSFLFGTFHNNGVYLVPFILGLLAGYIMWQKWHKRELDKPLLMLLSVVMGVGVVADYLIWNPIRFANSANQIMVASPALSNFYIASAVMVVVFGIIIFVVRRKHFAMVTWGIFLALTVLNLYLTYIMVTRESVHIVYSGVLNPQLTRLTAWYDIGIINFPLLLIFGYAIYLAVTHKKRFTDTYKHLLWALGVIIAVWMGLILVGVGNTADRMLYDVATIIGLATAVLVGVLWNKDLVLRVGAGMVIILGMFNIMPQWMSYKSTVTDADIQAIAYLNTLDYTTYTTSSQVQPSIYDLYIKGKYKQESKELLITRNKAMTLNSDITTHSYIPHGIDGTDGFILDKSFTDGKIIVNIYDGVK